jgi:hypothetical protein
VESTVANSATPRHSTVWAVGVVAELIEGTFTLPPIWGVGFAMLLMTPLTSALFSMLFHEEHWTDKEMGSIIST